MAEKASYAILLPSLFGYFGYRTYKHNILEVENRALALKEIEDKYL